MFVFPSCTGSSLHRRGEGCELLEQSGQGVGVADGSAGRLRWRGEGGGVV